MFEYCVNPKAMGFNKWSSHMAPFTFRAEQPYFSILVPTGETTTYETLLDMLVSHGRHVMLVGETGTGKSVMVHGFLARQPAERCTTVQASFSAQTSARNIQARARRKIARDGARWREMAPCERDRYATVTRPLRDRYATVTRRTCSRASSIDFERICSARRRGGR